MVLVNKEKKKGEDGLNTNLVISSICIVLERGWYCDCSWNRAQTVNLITKVVLQSNPLYLHTPNERILQEQNDKWITQSPCIY